MAQEKGRKEVATMLLRTDPFRDLDRFTQEVLGTAARPAAMPMDAWRDGDEFHVEFDLPGINADSLDLDIENNVVTVRAERAPVDSGQQPRHRPDYGGLPRRGASARDPGGRESQAPQDHGEQVRQREGDQRRSSDHRRRRTRQRHVDQEGAGERLTGAERRCRVGTSSSSAPAPVRQNSLPHILERSVSCRQRKEVKSDAVQHDCGAGGA
jgi:Hsp20/alpha crystallin family